MRISDWSSDVCSSDLKARLRKEMHSVWDEANRKGEEYAAKVLRGGQKNLDIEDFVDPEAAMDPGHFEPNAKLKAMDRDGVFAEVIFPEVAGAKQIGRASCRERVCQYV